MQQHKYKYIPTTYYIYNDKKIDTLNENIEYKGNEECLGKQ